MPKPQGTYLQLQKIAHIRQRAPFARVQVALQRPPPRPLKLTLARARNLSYLAHQMAELRDAASDSTRKAFAELVEELAGYREQLVSLEQLHAELREPHFEFRAARAAHNTPGAADWVQLAMATITLLMVLERLLRRR